MRNNTIGNAYIRCALRCAFAGSLLAFDALSAARAEETATRFCAVEIRTPDGQPFGGGESHRIDGLPSVVFAYLGNRRWTFDSERRLVIYSGPFPLNYLDRNHGPNAVIWSDHWVKEPWSGRIVATTWGNGAVSVIDPGSSSFRRINQDNMKGFSYPFLFPQLQKTIVTYQGDAYVVDVNSLIPWDRAFELKQRGMKGIGGLYVAPSIDAIIATDLDHNIFAIGNHSGSMRIGSLVPQDFGSVFDSPFAKASLFVAQKSVRIVRRTSDSTGFSATTLLTTSANGANDHYFFSRKFGQVLAYETGIYTSRFFFPLSDGKLGWRRLGLHGFEIIPGGDDSQASLTDRKAGWRAKDLNAFPLAIIEGTGGYFLYDGEKIAPVIDGERSKIGEYPWVYDLPSISKVIIKTSSGFSELKDSRLVELPSSFPTSINWFVDWPEAKQAIILTNDAIYAVDSDFKVARVMDRRSTGGFSNTTNPSTGDFVFSDTQKTFLIIDTDRHGQGPCQSN